MGAEGARTDSEEVAVVEAADVIAVAVGPEAETEEVEGAEGWKSC